MPAPFFILSQAIKILIKKMPLSKCLQHLRQQQKLLENFLLLLDKSPFLIFVADYAREIKYQPLWLRLK